MQDLTPEQEKKLRMAYVQTFGTEAGQIVLKDLQKRCFKYQTTFTGIDEPYGTLLREGARRLLLTIEELMSDEGIQRLAKTSGKGE